MKSSCVRHPSNEYLIIIRQWQVIFCEGNTCAAALMSYLEYWHSVKLEEKSKSDKPKTLLQWHTEENLEKGILVYKRRSIREAIKFLESKKVITRHKNPNPNYNYDRTKYFLFYPEIVEDWLDNYYMKLSKEEVEKLLKFHLGIKELENDEIAEITPVDCKNAGVNRKITSINSKITSPIPMTNNLDSTMTNSKVNIEVLRNTSNSDFDKSRLTPPSEISDNRVEYSAETEIQNSEVNNTNQEIHQSIIKEAPSPNSLLEKDQSSLIKENNSFISEKDKILLPVDKIGFASHNQNSLLETNTPSLQEINSPQSIMKGNNMSLLDKDTYSAQLPVKDNIPPPAAKNSIKQQLLSNPDVLKPESKYKPPTEPRMNDEVKSIINLWETLGLHKSKHITNSFKEGVKAVYSLMNGTLFQDNSLTGRVDKRKYTIADIELSIRRFAKAALDPNYLPEGKYKNTIKKYPLSVFLHNRYADKTKSLFIHYLENEPQLLNKSKVILLEDKHEDMTRRLRDYYLNTIMGGISIKLSIEDENHFILSSLKLLAFYKENGVRMLPMELGGIRKNLTNWLCESLSEKVGGTNDYNISNIAPSWFSSEITFNKTLPKYLLNQGIYETVGVSMSNKSDDINPHDYTNDDDDEYDIYSGKYSVGLVPGSSFTEKVEEEDPEELANQW